MINVHILKMKLNEFLNYILWLWSQADLPFPNFVLQKVSRKSNTCKSVFVINIYAIK